MSGFLVVGGGEGGASSLNGLSDVTLTTPTDSDFLARVSGSFVNRTPAQVRTLLGLGERNAADGYAGLDGSARLPAAQLPTTIRSIEPVSGRTITLSAANYSLDSSVHLELQKAANAALYLCNGGGNVYAANRLAVGFNSGTPGAAIESRSTSGEQIRLSYSSGVYNGLTSNVNGYLNINRNGTQQWQFALNGTGPMLTCNHSSGIGYLSATTLLGLGPLSGGTPTIFLHANRASFRQPLEIFNVTPITPSTGQVCLYWNGTNLVLRLSDNSEFTVDVTAV